MKQKIFTMLVVLTIVAMLPGAAWAAPSTRSTLGGSAPAWANSNNYVGAADANASVGWGLLHRRKLHLVCSLECIRSMARLYVRLLAMFPFLIPWRRLSTVFWVWMKAQSLLRPTTLKMRDLPVAFEMHPRSQAIGQNSFHRMPILLALLI